VKEHLEYAASLQPNTRDVPPTTCSRPS
jgi:hypothetical protein